MKRIGYEKPQNEKRQLYFIEYLVTTIFFHCIFESENVSQSKRRYDKFSQVIKMWIRQN